MTAGCLRRVCAFGNDDITVTSVWGGTAGAPTAPNPFDRCIGGSYPRCMNDRTLFGSACPAAALLIALSGCAGPLDRAATEQLRTSIVNSAHRELKEAEAHPVDAPMTSNTADLDIPPDRMAELETMAGPQSYTSRTPTVGPDLLGRPGADSPIFQISLQQTIQSAVRNNLSAQSASIDPAIRQSQLTAAEAVFDWVLFADVTYNTGSQSVAVPVVGGVPLGRRNQASDVFAYSTGLRKPLTTGGQLTLSQGYERANDRTVGSTTSPDPANEAFAAFALEQPLLRGFGSDVALSEIRLSENAERRSVLSQKGVLLDLVSETERAYWNLLRTRLTLQIRQRLLDRGIETRDILKSRLGVDARPAEYSDAVARVEARRADVIRAQRDLRLASDQLKRLINDPTLTVGDETLLVAIDDPMQEPVAVSLAQSLSASIADRPEVQQAILQIDDASIRQTVARNARLPLLNFSVQARIQGLGDDASSAYDQFDDFSFVQWLLGGVFEQPIGNRAAEAQFRERQLERMRSVIDYRAAVQSAVLRVKNALREVQTQFALISQTRLARIAAAENLRTLNVLEKTIASLSPDFLDLKFRRQDSLAAAEVEEVIALVGYNVAIAELANATGTGLEHNRIKFVVPEGGTFDTAP